VPRPAAAAPPEGAAVFTVAGLTAVVKGLLEGDPTLRDVWVEGEISNFKWHPSGHVYFTLKDETATLRCVLFRSRAQRLTFRPSNGMQVLVRGAVSVFERDGVYQCYAERMVPAGLGSLHLAFARLRARLEAEGLFDPRDKRPLPRLPRRVAVVTSPVGAAVWDVVRIARKRCPSVEVVVVPALVQGPEAPDSLVRALQLAARLGPDVVILARGGGSLEELWAFNDEGLARAIRGCPVPVVAGVGHETDVTIADLAADVRAPTPSGAAEVVFPDREALRAELVALGRAMERALRVGLARRRERLRYLASRGPLAAPAAAFRAHRARLERAAVRLAAAGRTRCEAARGRWESLAGRLHALSPLGVLARGYAICRLPDGTVVRRAEQAPPGTRVEVLLHAGRIHARVEGHGPGLA
jgi:exodeoxyribonuclease VII large subunit